MAFCNASGIPHSEFLEWDPTDRSKALAYELYKSSRCALCGTSPWEWEEDRFAYEVREVHCMGCYMKQTYSESLGKTLPGTTVELTKSTLVERAKREMSEQVWHNMMSGE